MDSVMHFCLMISFSGFIRWSISLNGYSGAGKPPMFGDFEAQRHWMEITYNLPIDQWYHNTSDNDLQYWGLDYPPLTAYHSWLCGAIASVVNSSWVDLHTSRGLEDPLHKLFMRYTVLASDVIYFGAVLAYCCTLVRLQSARDKIVTGGLLLTYPGLILIDHGHFQYNSVSLGLFLWGFVLISMSWDVAGAVAFCLALSFKQMELYHALPFFCYLLGSCFNGRQNWLFKLVKLGIAVILTFGVVWGPFFTSKEQILQVLHRVFPFARGLYEDKVANVWCSLSIFIKLKDIFTLQQLVKICLGSTFLCLMPSSLHLLLKPTIHNFKLALINASLVFFFFSFQVHEKSILLVAIPVLLLLPEKPLPSLWFLIISTFSMLPLLIKDGLLIPHVALTSLFFLLAVLAWQYLLTPTHPAMQAAPPSSLAEARAAKERREWDKTIEALMGIVFWLSMLVSVLLTIISVAFNPPKHLPDLWPVLVSFYSAGHFVLFLLYFHFLQFTSGSGVTSGSEVKPSKVKVKQERSKGKGRTFGNKKKVQ